jgi:hypothetical protein
MREGSACGLLAAVCLLSLSCNQAPHKPEYAMDPNEPQIVDGKELMRLEITPKAELVHVRITAYATWDLGDSKLGEYQALYFTGGQFGQLLVRCLPGHFEIAGETSPGYFAKEFGDGQAVQRDNEYTFSFPWALAFGKSDEVEAWVFTSGRDRFPDRAPDALTVRRVP